MAAKEPVKTQGKQVRLSSGNIKEHDTKTNSDPTLRRRISSLSTQTSDFISTGGGNQRRRSTLFSVAQSISSILGVRRKSRALSLRGELKDKPLIKLENTYKVDPDQGTVFKSVLVQQIIEEVLEYNLKDTKYDAERCNGLVQQLTNTLKNRMKEENFPRYKIVVNVIVGQSSDQGVNMASRTLWNPDTDNWACASFQNDSLFAIATVHGVYFE